MTDSTAEPGRLITRLTQEAAGEVRFGEGRCAWYAAPAPERETYSEDGALLMPIDELRGVLAVADGVGGHAAGALAAEMTLETLRSAVGGSVGGSDSLRGTLLDGIETANQLVAELGLGAATTLAAVEIDGHSVRPYHIGDSQIVIVGQRGRVRLETMAHSPVGYAVEAGLLCAKEALHHEDRHLVSNILGSPDMRIEIGSPLLLRPRDTVLLASDGLFDNMHLAEIVEVVRKGPLDQAVRTLADVCHERMRHPDADHPSKEDDLTILLYRLADSP